MSRYCQALAMVAVAALLGCGGGTASPNSSSSGSNGTNSPGTLVVSTSAIAFGNVALGSSTAQTGKLTAATSAVTISSASWNGDGFSVSGITFPVTLTSGQSASFTVTFAPQASGSASGGISFLSNASNSPTTETFTGTGSQLSGQPAHSVSLTWGPSPSTVIGYNVYRGTSSGGPYPSKLTSSPQSATSLVDNTVMAGTTYYYVATSVDQNSVESIYSNQLTATVP
jgi:Abnormal spindle-like microcephaly-assoc'd, ASPM-SPD-2-Hydin